jgi:mannose-6-phosphate isomerase
MRRTRGGGVEEPGVRSRPLEVVVKPWGSFSTLEEGPGYKIKRLVVEPGQRLSLQKHRHRAEHWVVVAGTATVVNGASQLTLRPRQCTVIPRGAWHRVGNQGRVPVVLIEVQHGAYLGEDDILRRADDYGRVGKGRAPGDERRDGQAAARGAPASTAARRSGRPATVRR